jgi:hypothetical protein
MNKPIQNIKAVCLLAVTQMFIASVRCNPVTWRMATVNPKDLTVGKKNELEWELRLPTSHPLTPGDCIEFELESKYKDKDYYQSFDLSK